MNDRGCQDIIERLAKLEQKTDDLEEFVKNALLHKIEQLEQKMDKKMDRTRDIVEKRFKWMLGLFITFFLSVVIPLILLVIK